MTLREFVLALSILLLASSVLSIVLALMVPANKLFRNVTAEKKSLEIAGWGYFVVLGAMLPAFVFCIISIYTKPTSPWVKDVTCFLLGVTLCNVFALASGDVLALTATAVLFTFITFGCGLMLLVLSHNDRQKLSLGMLLLFAPWPMLIYLLPTVKHV